MGAFRPPLRLLFIAAALAVVATPRSCWAQTKLYLKDGTYLLVRTYQIQGNRVHYYSIAEGQWEDMPLSLVDLKTTERAVTTRQEQQQRVLQEAEKTIKDNYQLPPNTGFQIAPGIRLPFQEGLYAYGSVRLITMLRSQGTLVRDKKRMALTMAVPGPFLKGRSLVVLPGNAAAVRIFSPDPTFYAQFADGAGSRLVLLHLKAGKNDREVEKIAGGRTGPNSESRRAIPLQVTKITPILYKLRPTQTLSPGEYALGEVGGDNTLNLAVWDFGIDSPNGGAKPEHHIPNLGILHGKPATRAPGPGTQD